MKRVPFINNNALRTAALSLLVFPAIASAATIELGGAGLTSVEVDPISFDPGRVEILAVDGPAIISGPTNANGTTPTFTGNDLQFTTFGPVAYATFALDVNEPSGGSGPNFSIDGFTLTNETSSTTLWDMDGTAMPGNLVNVQPITDILPRTRICEKER